MSEPNDWGMACPHCHQTDELDVLAQLWVRLTPDGTDADASEEGGAEWDDDSPCRCAACGWEGRVIEAEQEGD